MGPECCCFPNCFPDEDVAALSTRVLSLFGKALPDPADRNLYNRLMGEAPARGLSWLDALEFAAEQRCGSDL